MLTEGLLRLDGQVRITAEPRAAMVHLGDLAPAPAPLTASLWPGSYDLTVEYRGYQQERRTVVVTAGAQHELTVSLSKNTEELPPALRPSLLRRETAPRPKWRLATGGGILGAGVGLVAFGVVGVARDGSCTAPAAVDGGGCPLVYDTAGVGGAAIGIGTALVIGGTVLLGLPGPRRQVKLNTTVSQ